MNTPLVSTVKERCRMCYTCVRECPAKAIRVVDGQAEVIPERCIACGNCVRVCSQHAKQIRDSVMPVEELLAGEQPVVACVAPSFPAEFNELRCEQLVGMVRALGFGTVVEVAFGADLVARGYRELLAHTNDHRFIATSCPAVVGYVERYFPEMVPSLAPLASPMVATARMVRQVYGSDVKVVFIGPCIGKKAEAESPEVAGDVDAVLTFIELRQMFVKHGLEAAEVRPSDFDPPHGAAGGLFPIGRGMLQAADLPEDLMTGEVVAAEGRTHVIEAIKEFAARDLGAKLLEALCCEGCIMGAGIQSDPPLFHRRRLVRQHVAARVEKLDRNEWEGWMRRFDDLDLSRGFTPNDQRSPAPAEKEVKAIMIRLGKLKPEDELDCGACGYDTCREHAVAIYKGLAENEMCLPHTIEQLQHALADVEASHRQLADTQEALVQSEKLASMGQLAAGIAHEVNNPLGVVLMYAHLLRDDCPNDSPIRNDLLMITEQADRCKKIVAGLLDFARQNKVARAPVNLRDLVQTTLKTCGLPPEIVVRMECNDPHPVAEVDRDQIVQVLTNLITNAATAMQESGLLRLGIDGDEEQIRLHVEDTGSGIPPENLKRIFEPFFTTRRSGKGTGLGLAVTYGIIKMHAGDIRVESNADPDNGPTGTTFTVSLPRRHRTAGLPDLTKQTS